MLTKLERFLEDFWGRIGGDTHAGHSAMNSLCRLIDSNLKIDAGNGDPFGQRYVVAQAYSSRNYRPHDERRSQELRIHPMWLRISHSSAKLLSVVKNALSLTFRPSKSLFHSDCPAFADGHNDVSSARDFYYELLETHGLCDASRQSSGADPKDPSLIPWAHRMGYGNLELLYAFGHAVPDNSLPILWWQRGKNWNPLFNR